MAEIRQDRPTRYGRELYTKNPTIPASGDIARQRRTQLGTAQRGIIFESDTGEIRGSGGATIFELEEVDKERFVKLYLAGLKQAVGMSKAGMAVFQLVYDQMREYKERDFVLLNVLDATLPERTFHRGLSELLDRKFLYRSTTPGQFWVNIQYMFNGDRLAFVKAYQIKGSAPLKQLGLFNAQDEANKVLDELEGNI